MAPSVGSILYYLWHYDELRNIIQWKTWHTAPHERKPEEETASLRRCFELLDMTSRSFSMVIQELHPELLVPVALFYLILRGLDTIEDDMTISLDKKDPLLRDFKNIIEKPGWTFDGNGPDEKDRQLLVEFNVVIEEYMKIKSEYRAIVKDITDKMGQGMASYQNNVKKFGEDVVQTVDDYNLYCHFVAGLVGEGLTRLFVASKLANPLLLERDYLHESMGLFLQKTNIIRDIREDYDDRRRFYPKAIWSKHVDKFDELFDPANRDKALACISEMVLNALEHIPDCVMYLAGLREQSVFNFCAIPQTMAIGTLALVFQNPKVLEKNIKLTKGETCKILLESTQNMELACKVFRRYLHQILKKNNPRDPNFLKISIACSKGEQFIEKLFPTRDPKAQSAVSEKELADEAKKKAEEEETRRDIFYMMLFTFGALFVMSCLMIGLAYLMGARFDLAFDSLRKGKILPGRIGMMIPGREEL